MQVSFFKGGITDTTPTKHAPISGILEAIKNGFWKTQIEELRTCPDVELRRSLKMKLPYFTASGTFEKREDKGLISYSGLIQIDFDAILEGYLEAAKERISEDPYTYACFISPSGKGIKVLAAVGESSQSKHAKDFYSLEGYYFGKYGLRADRKVAAISMACFVSYDPYLFINPNPSIYGY